MLEFGACCMLSQKTLENNIQDEVLCTDGTTKGNTVVDEPLAMPSSGEKCEREKGESQVYSAVGRLCGGQCVNSGTECEKIPEVMKNDCEFKKGGVCKTHLVKGEKIVTKSKEWVRKKDGLFGYVTKQQTTYRCSRSAVIVGQPSPTIARETRNELDSGLWLGKSLPGDNLNWDCGVDIGGSGAKKEKSESSE